MDCPKWISLFWLCFGSLTTESFQVHGLLKVAGMREIHSHLSFQVAPFTNMV